MQAATSRFSAVLSVKKTESIRAARRWSPLATSFATTFDRFAALGTRINTGDSVKSETAADNKRHTNAHRPLTSHSPTGSTIPPPPPSHSELETTSTLSAGCGLYPNSSHCAELPAQRSVKPLGSTSTNKATVCEPWYLRSETPGCPTRADGLHASGSGGAPKRYDTIALA